MRDHLAIYADAMDACYVGGEGVLAQPGYFHGGWVTANLTGPGAVLASDAAAPISVKSREKGVTHAMSH